MHFLNRVRCCRVFTLALAAAAPLLAAQTAPVVEKKTHQELLKEARETAERGNRTEAIAMCTQVILAEPKHLNAFALRGRFYSEMRQDAKAIADFTHVINVDSNATMLHVYRGWSRFRLGQFKESVADYDRAIALNPEAAPRLWQRGIVLYYAGRYDDGRKQFELHQKVNPFDVENSAWHFLCTARQSSVVKAKETLIPVERDSRIPMKEIQALLAGKTTPEAVLAVAAATEGPARNDAMFFAHLYLGLYFEATGDAAQTREHILKAVSEFKSDHHMGDVARVHAEVLKRQKK